METTVILETRADHLKEFGKMFCTQFFMYCVCCISYRALAQARYLATFTTDITFGYCAYYVTRKIANSHSRAGQAGYVIGGAFGSLMAIWLTQHFWGR